MSKDTYEAINHPQYYRPGTYEAINVIENWELNFNLGCAVKYIARAGQKPDSGLTATAKAVQDLQKAGWYINREIQRLSGEQEE